MSWRRSLAGSPDGTGGRLKPVCLVLHAHLPYVKTGGAEETLEERWFGEAMADAYWPLLLMMERLAEEAVPYRLALSITPTLLAMLEDPEMDAIAIRELDRRIELARKETVRLQERPEPAATAAFYARRYDRLRREAARSGCGTGWLVRLRRLAERGCVELLAGVGTHPFLPLVATREGKYAQLAAGHAEYARVFGTTPRGVWLPECGYMPELDPLLRKLGYAFTVTEQPAGRTIGGVSAPRLLRTEEGVILLPRDAEASAYVWDAGQGYPGNGAYRDFYTDIGFELGRENAAELAYLRPYLLPDGTRAATGMKYARVTDRSAAGPKAPYIRRLAMRTVRRHADDWLKRLAEKSESAESGSTSAWRSEPLVCAFDAELFGHWWFEGPEFLESLFRAAAGQATSLPLRWATLSEALVERDAKTAAANAAGMSSWGRGGYADVWLQRRTDWMYPLLHEAEERLVRAANTAARSGAYAGGAAPAVRGDAIAGGAAPAERAAQRAALAAAARELMLAQSSDWAFYLDAGTMPAYAERRFREHLGRFDRLLARAESEEEAVEGAVAHGTLLPSLRYEWFCGPQWDVPERIVRDDDTADELRFAGEGRRLSVLMLAWEYPPDIVGGLGKAVGDLARELAAQGHDVHVVTRAAANGRTMADDKASIAAAAADSRKMRSYAEIWPAGAETSRECGVLVHRVPVLQSLHDVPFLTWVFQMNVAFADRAARLLAQGVRFDVLHAHDWLVGAAAAELAEGAALPLVATIHATEYGRRAGRLDGPVSPRLHAEEERLISAADEIIVCSEQMRAELAHLFAARPYVVPCGHPASAAAGALPSSPAALAAPALPARSDLPVSPAAPDAPASPASPQTEATPSTIAADSTAGGTDALALPPRSADVPVLAFLGRLVPEKGVQVLLRSLPHLLTRYPALTLVIAGEGPLRPELEALAAPYGESVRFAGFLAEPAKSALFARADLCVVPSLYEPFGLVALEAMAAGTPLLASDVGGLADIVTPGVDGLLCPPGDAVALAEHALASLGDPAAAHARAAAAQRAVRVRYAMPRVAAETLRVYEAAASKRAARSGDV